MRKIFVSKNLCYLFYILSFIGIFCIAFIPISWSPLIAILVVMIPLVIGAGLQTIQEINNTDLEKRKDLFRKQLIIGIVSLLTIIIIISMIIIITNLT